MDNEEELIRQELWTKRFYSFGTTKIFERRARRLKNKRQWITFLGLVTPLTVGAFVASFSIESVVLKIIVLPLAGGITVLQAVLSLWSLVAKWDENYSYAISAIKSNARLTSELEALAQSDIDKIKRNIDKLRDEYNRQEMEDTAQHITDKEKRYAMRQTLFQYKSACKTCGKVPESLTPTACDTCGKF